MDDGDRNDALSADEGTRYSRIAARANFMAHDRMDLANAHECSYKANDGTHNR